MMTVLKFCAAWTKIAQLKIIALQDKIIYRLTHTGSPIAATVLPVAWKDQMPKSLKHCDSPLLVIYFELLPYTLL